MRSHRSTPPAFAVPLLVSGMLLAATPAAADEKLVIRVTPASKTVMVGEPVVLSVHLEGVSGVYLGGSEEDGSKTFRVLVNRGAGYQPYRRPVFGSTWADAVKKHALDGGRLDWDDILIHDRTVKDWVCTGAKECRFVVEYEHPEMGVVRSNVASVSVRSPRGKEREVQRALQNLDWQILAFLEPQPLHPLVAPLVNAYPSSRYLHYVRINDLVYRMLKTADGVDPMDGTRKPMPLTGNERYARSREMQLPLIGIARELAAIESQFTPDALMILAPLQKDTGDVEGSRRSLERIREGLSPATHFQGGEVIPARLEDQVANTPR